MENEIQKALRTTCIGLAFQIILVVGLNLYTFGRNGIELNSIIIGIASLGYFFMILPKHYRVVEVGREILKEPANFTQEQKNEYLEFANLNIQKRVIGGSRKEMKILTGILVLMAIGFGYLYLKHM